MKNKIFKNIGVLIIFIICLISVNAYDEYKSGKSYSEGDIVENDGKLYECKPWPYEGWCSLDSYEPGNSLYWKEAWDLVGDAQEEEEVEEEREEEPEKEDEVEEEVEEEREEEEEVLEEVEEEVEEEREEEESQEEEEEVLEEVEEDVEEEVEEVLEDLKKPDKADISWMFDSFNTNEKFTIEFNMWWGENGEVAKLEENGKIVKEINLNSNSPSAQSGSFDVVKSQSGEFKYRILLCNENSDEELCSYSSYKNIEILEEVLEEEIYETISNETKQNESEFLDVIPSDGEFSDMSRILESATPLEGEPVVDLNNIENNYENVQRVMKIIDSEKWNYLFPIRHASYSYENFLKAVGKFPKFCNEAADGLDIDYICRKELAVVFAHFVQETGAHSGEGSTIWDRRENKNIVVPEEYRQGLYWLRENMGEAGDYRTHCDSGNEWDTAWPCKDGEKYYGRGAKQLSYMYNYAPFSKMIFEDERVLLDNPDLVAQEGYLALTSAMWFGMIPQPPKPSIHEVVAGFWKPNSVDIEAGMPYAGFGVTINIINGGLECRGSEMAQTAKNRVKYYREFAKELNIDISVEEQYGVLGCTGMKSFSPDGYGYVPIYWARDWSKEGACKLGSMQTPFWVFFEDGQEDCIKYHFGESTLINNEEELEDNENNENNTNDNDTGNEDDDSGIIDDFIGLFEDDEDNSTQTNEEESELVSNEAPAKADISWMPDTTEDTDLTIGWNMWYGENGDYWNLYENNKLVFSEDLTSNSPNAQSSAVNLKDRTLGIYEYVVELCSKVGDQNELKDYCSRSDIKTIEIVEDKGLIDSIVDDVIDVFEDDVETDNEENVENNENNYHKDFTKTTDKLVVGYYPEWGTYARNFQPNDVYIDNLDIILYSFIKINDNYEIEIWDTYAALDKAFEGDCWDAGCKRGLINQFEKIKAQNPELKIQFSIGGWTGSDNFHDLKDKSKRDIFTDSVIDFMREYPLFDGADVDWEFPGVNRGIAYGDEDTQTYTLLMKELREKLDEFEKETNREYLLTSAVKSTLTNGIEKVRLRRSS